MARKDRGPIPKVRRITLSGAKGARHPGFVKPQLATLHVRPPQGEQYLHEIKFDGYRLQAHLRGGLPALFTRSGLNWTKRFPPIAGALSHVPATELIVDGEVISANDRGAASFSQLQDDLSKSRYDRMVYYAWPTWRSPGTRAFRSSFDLISPTETGRAKRAWSFSALRQFGTEFQKRR